MTIHFFLLCGETLLWFFFALCFTEGPHQFEFSHDNFTSELMLQIQFLIVSIVLNCGILVVGR